MSIRDSTWNYWCNRNGIEQINEFVRNVAVQLRTQGVLLYCKQGANRSAAAAIAVIAYITGRPWQECEEMARRAGAIVDISRMAPRFTTIVNSFPARAIEDSVPLTQITNNSIATTSTIDENRIHNESSPKQSRTTGIWIFYNQAEDLDLAHV